MENTPENKTKFFALYWEQEVLTNDMHGEGGLIYAATMKTKLMPDGDYLLLKPLSQISDEDLEGIYPHGSEAFFIYYGNGNKELAVDRFLYKFQLQPEYIDFLRLRGYAVPWAGLSVEQLIEYGWIKLTEKP